MPAGKGGADIVAAVDAAAAATAGVPDLGEAARALAGAAESGDTESMSVEEIVAAYYNALSVRAHAEADRAGSGSGGSGGSGREAAAAAEAALEAFDRKFHPRALARLESVSDGLAERLDRDDGSGNGSGSGGDGDADGGEFDRLRAAMSAAEFARQYDRGLRRG